MHHLCHRFQVALFKKIMENEVGTINYVDAEGNVLHSWVFENWKSDDDFYLDLSAYLEPYASEELVAAYKVSLQKKQEDLRKQVRHSLLQMDTSPLSLQMLFLHLLCRLKLLSRRLLK